MRFDLKAPCGDCPFRSDIKFYLHPDRAAEIAKAVLCEDKTFACHKTTSHGDDGEATHNGKEQHCAGALIMAEKLDLTNANMMLRMAQMFGIYDPKQLKMDSPIYDNPAQMQMRMKELNTK